MNFPGVNSATFIEDIFLLTQTRLHQQPLYISVLLKASVSQLCIRTKKKKDLVMKIALIYMKSKLTIKL